MSCSETWLFDKLEEFKTAVLGRFDEENAIQASFTKLYILEQYRDSMLKLEIIENCEEILMLSNRLFVREWVANRFRPIVERENEFGNRILRVQYEMELDEMLHDQKMEYEKKMDV